MSENSAEGSKIFYHRYIMITPVGSAHDRLLWAQHTWRNWFWAAELTLGRTPIVQWGSSSGCWWIVAKANVQHAMIEFSSLYHYGTNTSMCLGSMLKNNGTSML